MSVKFEVDNIKDPKTKNIYKEMWGEFGDFFEGKIDKTYNLRYKTQSDNSYSFKENKNECKAMTLSNIFGIKNKGLFCSKYEMATGGAGNEATRILTLHSSSLCALLHFYNITKDCPLILEFSTNKEDRKVKYTKSVFEYKTNVINNPSNMDIVLQGKDGDEDIILFLESKFSEYYRSASGVSQRISCDYKKKETSKSFYEEDFLSSLGLKEKEDKSGYFKLELLKDKDRFYIDGIKQMISHYVGVMNAINNNLYQGEKPEEHREIDEAISKTNTKVILGEIIFDENNNIPDEMNACARVYREKYEKLAEKIATLQENNDRFEIIKETLSYSDLFKDNSHEIEQDIRNFYRE